MHIHSVCFLCVRTHMSSTGADCFDVISPTLMNTLICLTTCLSWGGKQENTIKDVAAVCLRAAAQLDLYIFKFLCITCWCMHTACERVTLQSITGYSGG